MSTEDSTPFDTAMERFRSKDFAGAIALFASVPSVDANYYRAQVGLGKSCYALHEYEAAIEHFARATCGEYDKPQIAFAGLAVCLAEVRRYDEAMAAMQQSLAIDPNNVDSVYNLGQIQLRAEQYGDAAESFRQAFLIRADPDYLAYGALCYSNIGDYPEAISMCQRVLKINEQSHLVHDVLAITYGRLSNYGAALKHSDIAIRLAPDKPGYLFNRGCTLEALKRYVEAIVDYTNAINLSPCTGKYYTNRANCRIALGDDAAAMDDLDTAIRLGDDVAYFNRSNSNIKMHIYYEAISGLGHFIALHPRHKDALITRSRVSSLLRNMRESAAD